MVDYVMLPKDFWNDLITSIDRNVDRLQIYSENEMEKAMGERERRENLTKQEYEARSKAFLEAHKEFKRSLNETVTDLTDEVIEIDEELAHHFKKLKEVDDMRRGENGKEAPNK